MSIRKTVTAMAIDSAKDYVQERLEQLKKLDLDKNGITDVDQVAELVSRAGEKIKIAMESTDFPKLSAGCEQIFSGFELIGSSIDREKVGQACSELSACLAQVGKLLQLGIAEVKSRETDK
jgi:hypothetical protein